jgi:hypothetical protein
MLVGSGLPDFLITILIVYCLIKLFEFYGIGTSMYGPYLAFYIFLYISAFVLPRYYYPIK